MTRLFSRAFLFALVLVIGASPAFAQNVILMDYLGYGWEDGGIPHSDDGDVLQILATATDLDALFGVDLNVEEATIYIYDLVSTGEFVDPGSGWTYISYSGGVIEVYEDSSNDHDWGTWDPDTDPFPPLRTTFTNGTKLFEGAFTDFTLTLTPAGAGGYEGNIDGIGGTVADLCDGVSDCAYTFGGAFTREAAQVLDGYDLQIDGTLEVDAAVPTESLSFGAVKALYEN